jgi:hypothetical protein
MKLIGRGTCVIFTHESSPTPKRLLSTTVTKYVTITSCVNYHVIDFLFPILSGRADSPGTSVQSIVRSDDVDFLAASLVHYVGTVFDEVRLVGYWHGDGLHSDYFRNERFAFQYPACVPVFLNLINSRKPKT